MSDRKFTRYLRLWSLLTGLGLVAIVGMNVIVDPIHLWGSQASPVSEYRTVDGSWPTKIEELRRGRWEGVIVGSSRAEVGLAPTHPAWSGRSVYNAAIAGARREGTSDLLRFALANNPIQEAILVVDFYGFSKTETLDATVALARLDPARSSLRHYAESLLGLWSTRQSVRTIRASLAGRRTPYDDLGMKRFKSLPAGLTHRDAFEYIFAEQLTSNEWLANFEYDADAVVSLEEDLVLACDAGIRLTIMVPPVHALHLELIHQAGLWEVFEDWKRELVATVEDAPCSVQLWDFSGYRAPTTETVPLGAQYMSWFWESSHFKKELGDLVMDKVLQGTNTEFDFGVRLDASSIEAEILRTRKDRARYISEHATEMGWFQQFVSRVEEGL